MTHIFKPGLTWLPRGGGLMDLIHHRVPPKLGQPKNYIRLFLLYDMQPTGALNLSR